jgi:hypothetical protein
MALSRPKRPALGKSALHGDGFEWRVMLLAVVVSQVGLRVAILCEDVWFVAERW